MFGHLDILQNFATDIEEHDALNIKPDDKKDPSRKLLELHNQRDKITRDVADLIKFFEYE